MRLKKVVEVPEELSARFLSTSDHECLYRGERELKKIVMDFELPEEAILIKNIVASLLNARSCRSNVSTVPKATTCRNNGSQMQGARETREGRPVQSVRWSESVRSGRKSPAVKCDHLERLPGAGCWQMALSQQAANRASGGPQQRRLGLPLGPLPTRPSLGPCGRNADRPGQT